MRRSPSNRLTAAAGADIIKKLCVIYARHTGACGGKNKSYQCACGHTFLTGTTKKTDVIKVEICSKCHPYFTGKQKLVDTGGRVDKFKKRYNLD